MQQNFNAAPQVAVYRGSARASGKPVTERAVNHVTIEGVDVEFPFDPYPCQASSI